MNLSLNIFLLFPLFLLLYVTTKNLLQKLQNLPPTPVFVFPVIGHIYLLKKPLHKKFYDLSKKYGPVFSLQLGSRSVVVINSPSVAEECLSKTNDIIFANRPRLLPGKHLGRNYTSIAWAPYGDHWRNLRRISSIELLSSQRIQSLSEIRLDEIRTLIRHLFQASFQNPGYVVEMRTVIFELMFNSMTRMILGTRYYGKNKINSDEAREFQEITEEMHLITGQSGLDEFIPLLSLFSKAANRYKALQERRDRFSQQLIDRIRRGGHEIGSSDEKGKTMTEVLLSLQNTDPDYYTDEIIMSLTAILLQAGSDTSVASMEWAMTLLLNNPKALRKAQDEIDRRVGYDRLIDETDIIEIPYLRCIINETLRLYPVAPLLLPHESSEACTIGGFHIPQGMMLLVNVWALHNDPKTWEDWRMFKPERFMGADNSKEVFKHLPFGKGRRSCPGEGLAMRMLGLVLGSLVQCFDWNRVSDEMEDVSEDHGALTAKAKPLMAKCQPRPTMLNLLSQHVW